MLVGRVLLIAMATFPAAAMPVRGGVMTYGRYADSLLLDPVLNDSNSDIWILSNLYDTLLLPSDDGRGLRPGLATSWRVSPDGLTVTLSLRQARFSDGSPITASDVKWSLDRARDPRNGIWNFLLGAIASVMIADPATIVLHMRHPDPSILPALSTFNAAIMPQRAFEASHGADDREKAIDFERHPVTSGPFVLQSWVRGATMRLRRNPDYWQIGEDGRPLPYLDGIEFELVADDATRILKVQSGELDGAELIPYSRAAELRRDPLLNLRVFPSTRVDYVVLNVRPTLPDGAANPLASSKVREALNDAVNRRGLIEIVTSGLGSDMTSYLSHATPLHVDVPDATLYDLDKARALLRQAGFPHGFAATMQIIANSEIDLETSTALQEMWSAIGIDLHLRQVDAGSLIALYRKGVFMMSLSAWTDDIADPDEATSYAVYRPTIEALHSGWHDDEADRLFVASGMELDTIRRAAEYARIQHIYEGGPIVRLFEAPYVVVLRRGVRGFLQLPLGNNIFDKTWLAR